LVLISNDVVVFNTVELALQLSDFQAVSIHLVTSTRPIFVDLINDKRGVAIYQEVFNTKFDSNAETMETSFILDGIIGGRKLNSKDISKAILRWRNKKIPAPAPLRLREPSKYMTQCLGRSA